jgi:hypothetical protein
MHPRTICRVFTPFALALVCAATVLAQSPASSETFNIPAGNTAAANTWQVAQQVGPTKGKLFVVTLDRPNRRQACRILFFTPEKLVCSRALGGPRTYLPQQVVALILPGDGALKLRLMLGLNGGLGAAIWGTVVLAAACPACAVATGIAAFFCFGAAGAIGMGDDQPDRLLYLARGQKLSRRLGYVESR